MGHKIHIFIEYLPWILISCCLLAGINFYLSTSYLVLIICCFIIFICSYLVCRYWQYLKTLKSQDIKLISEATGGYAEFEGTQDYFKQHPLKTPFSKTDCTWYSYKARTGHNQTGLGERAYISSKNGSTENPIQLSDNSSMLYIFPKYATVYTTIEKKWLGKHQDQKPEDDIKWGRFSFFERYLEPKQMLYVAGMVSVKEGATLRSIPQMDKLEKGAKIISDKGLKFNQPFIISSLPKQSILELYTKYLCINVAIILLSMIGVSVALLHII